jgi:hypothetical protein
MEVTLHVIVDHINLLIIPDLINVSQLLLVTKYFLVKSIKFGKYSASYSDF